ncbi:hypothetical protein R6Q59_017465 [Mikania micrantha]
MCEDDARLDRPVCPVVESLVAVVWAWNTALLGRGRAWEGWAWPQRHCPPFEDKWTGWLWTQLGVGGLGGRGRHFHNKWLSRFHNHPGMLYLIYAATLLYMFPSLMALVELKYQNKPHSPFETHGFFANMAAVAYIIAIAMSVTLFCLKARLKRSNPEIESPVYYRILRSAFYFSSLLAPLSLVLVLFFPHGFDFIGYSLVFTLFLVIVACSFSNYIKFLCKKDASKFEDLQRNMMSHSTSTITDRDTE